jgi:hypothetical protein
MTYHPLSVTQSDDENEFDASDDDFPEPPDPEEEFWSNWSNAPDPFETDRPQISSYWD